MTNEQKDTQAKDKLVAFIESQIKDKTEENLRIEGELSQLYLLKTFVNNMDF